MMELGYNPVWLLVAGFTPPIIAFVYCLATGRISIYNKAKMENET